MTDIHLNRSGINSIETSSAPVEVQAGSLLRLKLINHGAPIHLTLSSPNAEPVSDFYHQNVYVRDEMTFDIPIREDAFPGSFDLAVITGYGTVRASLKVLVVREAPPPPRGAHASPPVSRPPPG